MKKQKTVNTVHHNDEFSSGLMEQYGQWMGGDCFQNTDPVDLNLHEAPLVEEPFAGMDPQSHGAEVEEITKKKKSAKKESPKAQLDTPGVLEREEVEVDGEVYVLERTKDGWSGKKKSLKEEEVEVPEVSRSMNHEGYKSKKIAKIMAYKK